MTELHKLLDGLGLENLESQVYLAALPIGTVAASIIGNRLDIPRSSSYYTCEQLVKKGLMTVTLRGNTRLFTPENPSKLYAILAEQEEELENKRDALAKSMRQLQWMHNTHTTLPKVTFFEGIGGIERLLEELTKNTTDSTLSFGAGDYLIQENPEIIQSFRKKAVKQYKNIQIIRSPKYKSLHEDKDNAKMSTRYFKSLSELKVDFQICDDQISILSTSNSAPIWVLIKHKEIAEALRQIFGEIWENVAQ